MENGSCITLTFLWVRPKSGTCCAITWVSLMKPMEQLTAVKSSFSTCFPHWLPTAVALCTSFPQTAFSFLPSAQWCSQLCLVPDPSSVCLLSLPHSGFFGLWLQFSSLYSISPHLKSQLHSFTPQSAAPGCNSFRLFAPVPLHETSQCILLYLKLKQDMRPFSKGKVVRQ